MWTVSATIVVPNVCYRNFWENGAMTADGDGSGRSLGGQNWPWPLADLRYRVFANA